MFKISQKELKKTLSGINWYPCKDVFYYKEIPVPCGKCENCLKNYQMYNNRLTERGYYKTKYGFYKRSKKNGIFNV